MGSEGLALSPVLAFTSDYRRTIHFVVGLMRHVKARKDPEAR